MMNWVAIVIAAAGPACSVPPAEQAVALASARQAYSAIAPGSMRLRIIDGFVACPGESYAKAAHCRM